MTVQTIGPYGAIARNETHIERNEARLARNETCLKRHKTYLARGGNLHLSVILPVKQSFEHNTLGDAQKHNTIL